MSNIVTTPSSICILRLSAIGDVCHAVATVQAIQAKYPQATITWVIGKVEAMLLSDLANVEFVIFDKKAGIKGYRDLYQKMKGRKFDVLLHMQVALRASLATLCIRAKEKWGFDSSRAKEGQWIFTNKQIAPQKSPHVADGFFAFAKAIGVDSSASPKWNMPINDNAVNWFNGTIKDDQKYIVISSAASKAERNWLPERYAAIANHANQKGFTVYLSGGPTQMEETLGHAIIKHCDFAPNNLIGKTSLQELLVLLKNAELVLAPDSGPAHMATTVGTKVIGLYAHSNPQRTGPYHSLDSVVSVYEELLIEQTGKRISENRWGKRVKGDALMERISVEAVVKTFNRLLP